MCVHLSLAAVFTQNKAIQMSLNQDTAFCSVCEQIHPDPLSWECQQWSPRQEFWPLLWQGRLDPLGCGINATLSWFRIHLGSLSTQQKCWSFCACWGIVGSWWRSSFMLDPLLWQHSSSRVSPWVSLCPALWPAPQFHVESSVTCYLEIPRER